MVNQPPEDVIEEDDGGDLPPQPLVDDGAPPLGPNFFVRPRSAQVRSVQNRRAVYVQPRVLKVIASPMPLPMPVSVTLPKPPDSDDKTYVVALKLLKTLTSAPELSESSLAARSLPSPPQDDNAAIEKLLAQLTKNEQLSQKSAGVGNSDILEDMLLLEELEKEQKMHAASRSDASDTLQLLKLMQKLHP